MYLQNKYTKWYNSIISKARDREIESYTETHHIIPKSLGGTNDKNNLVKLTAREHFICHLLLVKMVEGKQKVKMANAAFMLTVTSKTQDRYKITNRQYEHIKLQMSILNKGKSSPKKGTKVTDPVKLANIRAAARLRSQKYKTGELDGSKVGKYIRTETHRQILREQIKEKPAFSTKGWVPSEETRRKISESNTGKPKKQSKSN